MRSAAFSCQTVVNVMLTMTLQGHTHPPRGAGLSRHPVDLTLSTQTDEAAGVRGRPETTGDGRVGFFPLKA